MNRTQRLEVLLGFFALCLLSVSAYFESDLNSCPLGRFPTCSPTIQINSSQTAFGCSSCPAGTSTHPNNLLSFYYSQSTSQATNYGCQQCQYGLYSTQPGSEYCEECPDGYQCSDSTIGPVPCPRGFYRSSINQNFSPNSAECLPCPKDTYANVEGSKECKPCPSGYFCPDPTSSPVACPKGLLNF